MSAAAVVLQTSALASQGLLSPSAASLSHPTSPCFTPRHAQVSKRQLMEVVEDGLLEEAGLVSSAATFKNKGVRANTRMNYMQNK